jgi:putative Mg2+ transporter-C (MgtC) family protein
MKMDGFKAEFVVLGQCLIAICLGGLVGWERETAGKWAGIRTHMLVCLAAMLFVRVGEFLVWQVDSVFAHDTLRADPVRIVEAIVTGIAFIGAGVVFRDRDQHVPRGLTTAASMLVVAPIGIAVAVGRYVLAVGITALVFIVLRGVNWLEIQARLKQRTTVSEFRSGPRHPRPNPQFRNDQRGRERGR